MRRKGQTGDGVLQKNTTKGGKTSVRDLSIERMTTLNNCIVNLLKWIFFYYKSFYQCVSRMLCYFKLPQFVSYPACLTGSCASGHSLQCVGPCGVLLLGHGGLAATLCTADRGWPLVSHSSVTSHLHPPPSSLYISSSLPTILWEETGVTSGVPADGPGIHPNHAGVRV